MGGLFETPVRRSRACAPLSGPLHSSRGLQPCHRTAVMQEFPDFVPAFSHHLKPLMRDGSQFTSMLFHPRIDGGIAFDSAVESQQLLSHLRPIFALGSIFRGTLHEKGREKPGRVLLFAAYPKPN